MIHKQNCDCYECSNRERIQNRLNSVNNLDTNYPDEKQILAGKYIGAIVQAQRPFELIRFTNTGTQLLRKVKSGERIGTITGDFVYRDENLYLSLNYFSGKSAGWVLYKPGIFDNKILNDTNQSKAIQQRIDERKESNKSKR
jgi:hypothetical protein